MNFFNNLKKFFGFSDDKNVYNEDTHFGHESFSESSQDRSKRFPRYHQDLPVEEEAQMGINVFSNPLEIAKFFEQQIDAMMKSMQSFGGTEDFNDFFSNKLFDPFGTPAIQGEEGPGGIKEQQQSENLRDHYLKPGYRKQHLHENKSDTDLDGRIDMDDLSKMFENKDTKVLPFKDKPKFHLYGQSVISKTIRRPDGTIETHRTVKDQEGNEETIVTHKLGDKEYSVTTRIDKEGRKEIIENLVNMDEKEKDTFLKQRDSVQGPQLMQDWPIDWYQRFFR